MFVVFLTVQKVYSANFTKDHVNARKTHRSFIYTLYAPYNIVVTCKFETNNIVIRPLTEP